MRIVLQRAKDAKVIVNGESVGAIEKGFVLLVGITHDDTEADADYLVEKSLVCASLKMIMEK